MQHAGRTGVRPSPSELTVSPPPGSTRLARHRALEPGREKAGRDAERFDRRVDGYDQVMRGRLLCGPRDDGAFVEIFLLRAVESDRCWAGLSVGSQPDLEPDPDRPGRSSSGRSNPLSSSVELKYFMAHASGRSKVGLRPAR